MATEAIELYLCETHGWVKGYRYILTKDYEVFQLCPFCGEQLQVIDIDEARAMWRKFQESENG
jgi:transcription initiation factor IIE alpha subunit